MLAYLETGCESKKGTMSVGSIGSGREARKLLAAPCSGGKKASIDQLGRKITWDVMPSQP